MTWQERGNESYLVADDGRILSTVLKIVSNQTAVVVATGIKYISLEDAKAAVERDMSRAKNEVMGVKHV